MEKKNETAMKTRMNEYLAAGVKPLEWRLYPVSRIPDGGSLGYYSKLFVNSLKIGSISPDTYEPCTAATLRGAKLAMWQLEKAVELFDRLDARGKALPMVTISMPLKMFLGKTAKRAFTDFLRELSADRASKICFAFTPEVLFMEPKDINPKLEEMNEKGLKTALVGYGEEYCPPLRLKRLKFDYIYFAPEFSLALEREEPDALALARLARSLGFICVSVPFKNEKRVLPPIPEERIEDYPADYITSSEGVLAEELFGEDSV